MSAQWPPKDETVARILEAAESYANGCGSEHPEDIADALVTAIEVAWRMVRVVE